MTFQGKARWMKHLYTPDNAFGASKYKAGIWVSKETADQIKKAGVQKKVKEDEKGPWIEFTRDEVKVMKGQPVFFTPPILEDKNGASIISYVDEYGKTVKSYNDPAKKTSIKKQGENILIGNDSDVQLTVAVFDTMKGKGQRLESVRILDLIEYRPEGEQTSFAGNKPAETEPAPAAQPATPTKKAASPF